MLLRLFKHLENKIQVYIDTNLGKQLAKLKPSQLLTRIFIMHGKYYHSHEEFGIYINLINLPDVPQQNKSLVLEKKLHQDEF